MKKKLSLMAILDKYFLIPASLLTCIPPSMKKNPKSIGGFYKFLGLFFFISLTVFNISVTTNATTQT